MLSRNVFRLYLAEALSLRNLEEMMAERGIVVDYSTLHQWGIRQHGEHKVVTIDKSGANTAALNTLNTGNLNLMKKLLPSGRVNT
jgi:transposase-like protein